MPRQQFDKMASLQRYNGEKPLVVVDTFADHPDRGDTHGHMGIAKRIAERTGAELLHVDFQSLEALYPATGKGKASKKDHDLRLQKLFEEKGYPDFFFSCHMSLKTRSFLNKRATGVLVNNFNENILEALGIHTLQELVPHHLTPQMLKYEGHKFATEFQELPRPFIAVNASELAVGNKELAQRVAGFRDAHPQAAFFVTSCHRVHPLLLREFTGLLAQALGDAQKFPVIAFDYVTQMDAYGKDGVCNPYVGLLDQADHIIVEGASCSMVSEALMTGKTVHVTSEAFEELVERDIVKDIFARNPGEPLPSSATAPIDVTGMAASRLIKLQGKTAFQKAAARARRDNAAGPLAKTVSAALHKLGALFETNYKIV